MNDNLEVKVNELTNAIRGLSDKPTLTAADVNNVLNNMVKKVEDVNEAGFNKLANGISDSILSILNEKYDDINGRLSVFEEFVASVEKTIKNPKVEGEVTRILNDIEALHSKMSSQEMQTEGLVKSLEALKNSQSTGQISKLCDDIVSISKSYDGITEVLNGNFQEFLRRIEALSSREELQRLRYLMESVEENQNVLVSAMNAVNDKQEEIKNLIKQSSGVQNSEKIDQLQGALSKLNELIIDTTSKADLDIIVDKILSLTNFLNDFRRSFDEKSEHDVMGVLQGQLNNIISKLEGLKLDSNSNVNEDIIRLYTSIAEFKDGVYSNINTQLNDVIASMDVQFDKISNSLVNTNLDSGEAITNMTGELQKLNSLFNDEFTLKVQEIKQDLQKLGQENVITVVNSIKGELSSLVNQVSSMNNTEEIMELTKAIENLRSNSDTDTLMLQIERLKSSLDLDSVKEQLALLNKDELLNTVVQKINYLVEHERTGSLVQKIDDLKESIDFDKVYDTLDSINQKVDFTSIEEKISSLKEFLTNTDFSGEITSIRNKLSLIDNIGEELVSVKNIDIALADIKRQIEDSFKLNLEKNEETIETQASIKETLKTIYDCIVDSKQDSIRNLPADIKANLELVTGQIADKIFENNSHVQNVLDTIKDKIDILDSDLKTMRDAFSTSTDEGLVEGISRNLNDLGLKLNDSMISLNSKFDETSNGFVENLNLVNSRVEDVIIAHDKNIESSLNTFKETVNEANSKVETSVQNMANTLDSSIASINEKLEIVDSKLSDDSSEKLEGIKEQLEVLYELVKYVSKNPLNEQIEVLQDSIINSNLENIREVKTNIGAFHNSVAASMNSIKNFIMEAMKTDSLNESFTALFGEFEARLNEKVVSLETLIEESGASADEKTTTLMAKTFAAMKEDLKNTIFALNQQISASQTQLLGDLIKNTLSEVKIEMSNSLKQESDLITSFMAEKTEISQKEILTKLAQIIVSRENTEARVNLIKTITSNLDEILSSAQALNGRFDDNKNALEQINTSVDLMAIKLEEFVKRETNSEINALQKEVSNVASLADNIKDTLIGSDNNIKDVLLSIKDDLEAIQSDSNALNGGETIIASIEDITRNIDSLRDVVDHSVQKFDSLNEESIDAMRHLENVVQQTGEITSDKLEALREVSSNALSTLSNVDNKTDGIQNSLNEVKTDVENAKNTTVLAVTEAISKIPIEDIKLGIESLENSILKKSDKGKRGIEVNDLEEAQNTVITSLNNVMEQKNADVQTKMDEIAEHIHNNINNTRDKVEAVKEEFKTETAKIIEQINKDKEELKEALQKSAKDTDESSVLNDLTSKFEQKLQDRILSVEALIETQIDKLDSKATELINHSNEDYKNSMDDKLKEAIELIKSDFDTKLADIQKVIDGKIYEVINQGNEVLKDELKLRADLTLKEISKDFRDKITKIEAVLVKETAEDEQQQSSYTLADVESDIAKIRLGLEKNNKLSNFKEFASRLVELKNINLENAKIARVIGSDIMRFDGWLKNTTAKIDVLAAKIDKSEKIKMEDLKSRIIQSDKNQAMPQKLEEAIMTIYKKYRTQENKIEDMITKLEALNLRQAETFDAKEFIDLIYDNTKKQENLINRMDGIEDKMDLIQAKIDHIISSCIDE